MMAGKRHHIIPQLHLRYFVGHDPKDHVWTYDAQAPEPRSSITKETGLETHFYSFEMSDGTLDTTLDDYITGVENKAAPIYREILSGNIPAQDQARADFSTFLAIMYVRTTAMRRMAAETYAQMLQVHSHATAEHDGAFDTLMRRMENEEGRKLGAKERETYRRAMQSWENLIIEVPKECTIHSYRAADDLMDKFFNMKWAVGEAKNGFFITSDNPLFRRVDPKSVSPIYGDGGFQNKTVQITFPLSPKRILILNWLYDASHVFQLPRDFVDGENVARAATSDRFLYSHLKHKGLMKLAHKYKSSRPEMKVSGMGIEKFAEVKVGRRNKS